MFDHVLIANRGEVAIRVAHACRKLGLGSVAVYSDADAGSPHVSFADEAVHIGAAPAAESYLNQDAMIAAAKATGANAIHPGYGFLAENADFARRCAAEGVVFIGPHLGALEKMADKQRAREFVAAVGVPVIPGASPVDQSAEALRREADKIGFPIMLKATAGGGGMGIRLVTEPNQFAAELAAVRHEATQAFGNDTVVLEKYFPHARHIEVQLMADQQGNYLHLFERECSIQRRRQKVLEEAPAPNIVSHLRTELCHAAIRIAAAIEYDSIGTVEFLLVDERIYFLEMNTRLQVEHGVTEQVTGVDLVTGQIRAALGQPLPLTQDQIELKGHAVECRVCAEDPQQNFQPAVGQLAYVKFPELKHIRVDVGIQSGSQISVHYDSLLAKLIGFGWDRNAALRRVYHAVCETELLGVANNLDLLAAILQHGDVKNMAHHTTWLTPRLAQLLPALSTAEQATLAVLAAWHTATAWPVDALRPQHAYRRLQFDCFDHNFDVAINRTAATRGVAVVDDAVFDIACMEHQHQGPLSTYTLVINGQHNHIAASQVGELISVHWFHKGRFQLTQPSRFSRVVTQQTASQYSAIMPGRVIDVPVNVGDNVQAGQTLIVLESMKMEHTITAKTIGTVRQLLAQVGDTVAAGFELISIDKTSENTSPLPRGGEG